MKTVLIYHHSSVLIILLNMMMSRSYVSLLEDTLGCYSHQSSSILTLQAPIVHRNASGPNPWLRPIGPPPKSPRFPPRALSRKDPGIPIELLDDMWDEQ